MIDFKKDHLVTLPANKILEMLETQRSAVEIQRKHLDVLCDLVSIMYDLDQQQKARKIVKLEVKR